MNDQVQGMSPALQLLLSAARVHTSAPEDEAIRALLREPVDWTSFAQKAIDHELAGLAGSTMARVAGNLLPGDILDAFHTMNAQMRVKNNRLFGELVRIVNVLRAHGIEAIPLKGPLLALQAYGDLGLRMFRDLDFLIRDTDIRRTAEALRQLGYERASGATRAQYELIHWIQGQEILFKKDGGIGAEPHSRLTPVKMALDVDYPGLWSRARSVSLLGETVMVLAPEDELITLSIHGGKEMWWSLKWVCDIAAFIASHPELDWQAILTRAGAQGCLRMVLLAVSLAQRNFGSHLPETVVAMVNADKLVARFTRRIAQCWQKDGVTGPPSNKRLSLDRLLLHDGLVRRIRYVTRTLFLPAPQHVGLVALPRSLGFVYIPIRLLHDLIALPLWRAYRHVYQRVARRNGQTHQS